ncbi:MAG: hypothetical protein JSV51_09880 [Candidatus Bathyarchaeota archaeon]|nr:MAG: hypothetical protein JSV51_09880 [Candidatus Bathyarchaeota archaeon]
MSKPQKRRNFSKRSQLRRSGSPQRHKPRVTILKRDGRVQKFNRVKMITSIRNAGATRREADLVTNRVSKRLANREAVHSKEVSSMVARSLSRVNSTASRSYVNHRNQKLAYTQRVNRLSAEITAISHRVNGVAHRIESFENRIQSLPTRIARVRQGNYRVLTHLEVDQASLAEKWMELGPELRTLISFKDETLRARIWDLRQALTHKLGYAGYDLSNLQDIELRISEMRLSLSEMQSSVANVLTPLEKKFQSMDKDLRKAESTVSLLSNASFSWEEGETPIIAARAKDLDNDLNGFIVLTNFRFIFEHEKEIVLKKVLFIATEKKIERKVVVQKPIGMVSQLVHGKVGFFKGSGLFVEFASESGIADMKFDTTSQDAKSVTESYNYIISGQAEEELATVTPTVTAAQKKPKVIVCPVCGAPYNEKIYRGQTSVTCKYCGAVVSLQ